MSQADIYYNKMVEDIIINGVWDRGMDVRPKWKDGTPAYSKSLIGHSLRFDNKEVPILTGKKVFWESAVAEGPIWIWQKKSNVVQDLRDLGSNVWNEWERPDGTIGKAYGYQLGKVNQRTPVTDELLELARQGFLSGFSSRWEEDGHWAYLDQVDYLLYQLKVNPSSRRHITMLWNPDDIWDMSLTPCVYETQWHVKENKLYLEVRARSNDLGLGHPFNVFQYNVLQRMFAQILGYELGEYIFHIGDAHIYDRHIDVLADQLSAKTYDAPQIWINPMVKSFYDFTVKDVQLINYQHGPFRKMEVAL